jgi:hypothetical protein
LKHAAADAVERSVRRRLLAPVLALIAIGAATLWLRERDPLRTLLDAFAAAADALAAALERIYEEAFLDTDDEDDDRD